MTGNVINMPELVSDSTTKYNGGKVGRISLAEARHGGKDAWHKGHAVPDPLFCGVA